MEYFYYTIIANYITDKNDFVNLMCVNTKTKKLNKWFKTINSPFEHDKLFPNNEGPKRNNWDIIYITSDNNIKTKLNYGEDITNIKKCYLHSIKDPLAVSSRYKELPKIIIPSNKILSGIFRFNHLDNLREVSLPTTLTTIENKFQHCNKLTKIIIPSTIITIKNSFYHCDSLKEMTIPSNVKIIKDSINFCDSLSTLKIASLELTLDCSINHNNQLLKINVPKYINIYFKNSVYRNNNNLSIDYYI